MYVEGALCMLRVRCVYVEGVLFKLMAGVVYVRTYVQVPTHKWHRCQWQV